MDDVTEEWMDDEDDYAPLPKCPVCGGSGVTIEGWDCEFCDGNGELEI